MSFSKRDCPYCQTECEADWVDVGVGHVQCGPYYCQNCGASEIGAYDNLGYDRNLECIDIENPLYQGRVEYFKVPSGSRITQEEYDIGWYKPGAPLGSTVNTCGGKYVKHDEAKMLYDIGLLDDKEKFEF
jgi:hypothetical protein